MFLFFKEWLIQIISVVMIIVIIELILPENSNKKYINMVLGLLIVLTIISPVIKIIGNPEILSVDSIMAVSNDSLTDSDSVNLEEVKTKQDEYILKQAKTNIQSEIKLYTESLGYKVDTVETDIDLLYKVKKLTIGLNSIQAIENKNITEISDKVSDKFEIDKKVINISMER